MQGLEIRCTSDALMQPDYAGSRIDPFDLIINLALQFCPPRISYSV